MAALSACGGLDFDGRNNLGKPFAIDVQQGAPLLSVASGDRRVSLAIDTGSPITVIADSASAAVNDQDIGILDAESGHQIFVFRNIEVFDLSVADVGINTAVPIDGLLGADVLKEFSVELQYATAQPTVGALTLYEDKDPTNEACNLTQLAAGKFTEQRCVADFRTLLLGGGRIRAGGDERVLAESRIVIPACLSSTPLALPLESEQPQAIPTTGIPSTTVIATGLGVSLIARSTVKRLQQQDPAITVVPNQTLYLPTGPREVDLVDIPGVALVASRTERKGPCGELALRYELLLYGQATDPDDRDLNGAAVAEVTAPETIRFAILADDDPILRGLQEELRPRISDIDVLISGSLLQYFSILLNYPSESTELRCSAASGAVCRTLPRCDRGGNPPCFGGTP